MVLRSSPVRTNDRSSDIRLMVGAFAAVVLYALVNADRLVFLG
jgi:hypothetical protein